MLITALILTASIPILGIIAECVNRLFKFIIQKLFGPKFTNILCNYITFPGTVHHELSHALLTFLTGAKIDSISLFKPNGDSLGSVEYHNRGSFVLRAIQNSMSAIAPVLCGAATSSVIIYAMLNCKLPILAIIVLVYILISIILHMRMSRADIKIMWKGIPVIFLLALIVVWLTKFDILRYFNIM